MSTPLPSPLLPCAATLILSASTSARLRTPTFVPAHPSTLHRRRRHEPHGRPIIAPGTPVASTPLRLRRSGGLIPHCSPSAVLHPHLLECAARPLQVDTPDLLRAALPPADPAALVTVPREGRVLVRSGLGSVFVIIYQGASFILSCSPGMPMLPARVKTPVLYLTPVYKQSAAGFPQINSGSSGRGADGELVCTVVGKTEQ
ncbi:hypothetical protein DFH08DRAFT_946190 [Mycena albidolilacea]|uniref:Uncharacterized protein n=1 Tax=Mycena albidolilacea TaxID=1033008 RepID=A0AAD6YX43_9AGAR|nr:hypothetical protein DFH08DRAFT_946190 [Mycena albidolilacea]